MIDKKLQEYEKFYQEIHERLEKGGTRYGIIIVIFGIILTQFMDSGILIILDPSVQNPYLKASVIVGGLFFIYALLRFTMFIWPKDIAFKGLPKKLYEDTFNQYLKRGNSESEAEELLKKSKLMLLEDSCSHNYNVYKKKRANYYHTIVSAIISVLLLTPSFVFSKWKTLNKTLTTNNSIIMSDDNNKPDKEKPIRVEPEFIKESEKKPQNRANSSESDKNE